MLLEYRLHHLALLTLITVAVCTTPVGAQDARVPIDYLNLANGAVPVAIDDAGAGLRVGMEHALQAIDGNPGGFSLTPKPGGPDAGVWLVYKLPALTRFSAFAIPNVLETPSPSQTFIKDVEISGSDAGPDGPFRVLGTATLETHAEKGQTTAISATDSSAVRWIKVKLTGGIDIQRDQTFFDFSEIAGYGQQESIPMSTAFDGKWSGRGVKLELIQDDALVTGCYDRLGELNGSVMGSILRATGQATDTGVPSTFVLTVGDEGDVVGVRSTNGAPFRLYLGDSAPDLETSCSEKSVPPLGCGSVIHGINFDFDSATIRPESSGLLDDLTTGLVASSESSITVVGHTSSEGSDAYNEELSQRRAESVVEALVERGVAADRLGAAGRGETEPIAENTTEAGRSLNRRVEISCPTTEQ